MKFSLLALAMAAVGAFAAEAPKDTQDSVQFVENDQNTNVENEVQLANFKISYVLEGHPETTPEVAVEFLISKPINILYTLVNEEERDISIVGVGGDFVNPTTGEKAVTINANSIGPIVVKPGQLETFRQKVNLDMSPESYALVPNVYVAFDEALKVIQAPPQLVTILEDVVSFFDPQLLLLELILVAAAGVVVYFFFPSLFQSYFKSTAPVTVKSSVGSSSSYDPNWIPKSHLQKANKPKTRKAY